MECGTVYKTYLQQAADAGSAALVREAARRVLLHRMLLGFFDPMDSQPLLRLNDSTVVHGAAHQQARLHANQLRMVTNAL